MDILACFKSFTHINIAADGCYNAQFNLRVIRGDQQVVFIPGNECFSYLPAPFCPHRYVLQVRVGAAKPARYGHRLRIIGMHPACFFVNQ